MPGADAGRVDAAFSEYLLALGLSDSTIRNYQAIVRRANEWAAANDVDLLHAGAFELAGLAASFPRSSATLRTLRCGLTHWFEMNDRWDAPLRAIRVPKKPKPEYRGVPVDDARSLIKASIGWHPEGTAVLLALYTGARRAEIAATRYDHIDPLWETISVLGKGAKTRVLPLHPVVRAQLRRNQGAYVWVFPGQGRRPHIHEATVWSYVARVAEAAGVRYLTPHMLRHTTAEMIIETTDVADIRVVRDFLGHERTETTERYLDARVRHDHLMRAVRALDGYLDG